MTESGAMTLTERQEALQQDPFSERLLMFCNRMGGCTIEVFYSVFSGFNRIILCMPIALYQLPDGKSALMLAAARLRHIAGAQWGTKRYLKMVLLRDLDLPETCVA